MTDTTAKLKVLVAMNEANRLIFDLLDSFQRDAERLNKRIAELEQQLKEKQ